MTHREKKLQQDRYRKNHNRWWREWYRRAENAAKVKKKVSRWRARGQLNLL
jgi:hypothetical protein